MSPQQAATLHPRPEGTITADLPALASPSVSPHPSVYHPSAALRRLLTRQARDRAQARRPENPRQHLARRRAMLLVC